jgi:tetratricopeptide (TPR) repeat protein
MYDFVGKNNIDKVPFWLAEGFAERGANANTLSTRGQWYFLEHADSILSFEKFNNDSAFLTIPFSYAWARQLCDYIIETNGLPVIKKLASHPDQFDQILGKTKNEFYRDFINHLKVICKKCLFCSGFGMSDSLLQLSRKRFDEKYTSAVNKGDSLFKAGQYKQAIMNFQESLLFGYQYSVKFGGIPDADKKIDNKTRREIYDFDIKQADKLFKEGNFSCAKQYYLFALYFFKDEVYPKNKIIECDVYQKPN